ncbi:MAG TPA: PQQ-dependent dehydrogenase, methanol/ethanol family [Gemmatimonadaceae bacterium]|nr:PQQ-dependent dehydrogenase, methanol/ethanol family [Gemmatimonadaceae bacterium]
MTTGRLVRHIATAGAIVFAAGACMGTSDRGLSPARASNGGASTARGSIAAGTAVGGNGEWATQGHDYALSRYSDLAQVTTTTAKHLKLAWSFSTGALRGHEGAPLVVGNTMYLVTPFPNVAYAIDLAKPPAVKWRFQPNTDPWAVGVACCDVVIRGWAYDAGKLIYNLLDDRTIALDANTGKLLWQTKLADVNEGITMTMAPLVVKGKVLVGNSGGEMGARGWLAALDENTGKELWRAFSTGTDSDVKIGPRFHAFYAKDRGRDLGLTTWPPDGWKHGAGTVWGWISYDPTLNLVYYGTSNPGPWNQDQRPGDNKWTSTIFARDPDTGEAVWAYQVTPHDLWDYDAVNENILADLPIGGTMRKVLVHFDRNAFGYTIDRATGEVLVARPFSNLNWSTGIDLKSGTPNVVESKKTHEGATIQNICPPDIGGKDQQPAAFSPRTGLFYVPTNNECMDYTGIEASYIAGTPYWGARMERHAGPGGNRGAFVAWDATTGSAVWSIPEKLLVYSGALVTAGDVVFYGTVDGWFKAIDARTGQELWRFKTGSGVIGAPITYLGPDGKQYVAVLTGVGGAAGVDSHVDGYPSEGGELYVFSL